MLQQQVCTKVFLYPSTIFAQGNSVTFRIDASGNNIPVRIDASGNNIPVRNQYLD